MSTGGLSHFPHFAALFDVLESNTKTKGTFASPITRDGLIGELIRSCALGPIAVRRFSMT